MKKISLLFISAFLLFIQNNTDAQQTIWLSPLSFVGETSDVNIVPSIFTNINSAAIASNNLGVNQAVLLGLNLSSNQKIDSLIIHYQLSNSASFINQIRITEMTNPSFASVIFDDGTDLTSTTSARYSTFIGSGTVNGTITLVLFLNFADPGDVIYIGAIGVVVSQSTTSANDEPRLGINRNFKLEQNYPNPFNPTTQIDYYVANQENVKINIFNSNGELLKTLLNEEQNAGEKSVVWNGRDNSGNIVSSGVYYYQIQVGNFTDAKKMIMLK